MFYVIAFATANSGTTAQSVVAAERGVKKVGDFRVLSGFDSLNASFHSNWPFGPSYAVAVDPTRGYVFMGSGGGVVVLDSNLAKVSEIRTRGVVWDLHYDFSDSILYIAAGKGGLEIWDVSDPANPTFKDVIHAPGEFRDVDVVQHSFGDRVIYIAAGSGGVHVYKTDDFIFFTHVGTYTIGGNGYALEVVKFMKKIYVAAGDSGLIVLKDNYPNPPTHLKSINTGYVYALDVGDFKYRGDSTPSAEIYFLSGLTLRTLNTTTLNTERYMPIPNAVIPSPSDVKVFAGYIWISNRSRTDTALIRVHPRLNNFWKVDTWGPVIDMEGSGEYLYTANANYGVNKIRVIKDTLIRLSSSTMLSSCVPGALNVLARKSENTLHIIATNNLVNGLSYMEYNLTTNTFMESCSPFSAYNGGEVGFALGPSKYAVIAYNGSYPSAYDSVFVIDTTTQLVVSSAPIAPNEDVLYVGGATVWKDSAYVAFCDADYSYMAVYHINPSTGNLTFSRIDTLFSTSLSPCANVDYKTVGDYIFESDVGNIYDPETAGWNGFSDFICDSINPFSAPHERLDIFDFDIIGTKVYAVGKCYPQSSHDNETIVFLTWDLSFWDNVANTTYNGRVWMWDSLPNDFIYGPYTTSIDVVGDIAVIAFDSLLYIYDIGNPWDIKLRGSDVLSEEIADGGVFIEGDTLIVVSNTKVYRYKINAKTNPSISSFYTTWGWTRDVEVYGNYAYLAIEDGNDAALFGGQDLVILDISGTQPTYVSGITLTGEAEGLTVANDTVYMAMGENGVYAIDVTNKTSPSLVNTYNTPGYAYDVYCDCALFGSGLLFIADSSSLYAIDHSSFTYHEDYGMAPNAVAVGVATSGGVAYVAMKGGIDGGLLAVDVSGTPFTYLGKYTDSYVLTDAMDVSLDMFNNLAYVAYMDNGMDAIDISDPTAMSLQGYWYEYGNKVIGTFYDATGGKVYIANYYDGFVGSAYDPLLGSYYTTSRYTTPSGPRDVWYRDGKVYTASVTAGMQVYTADVATAREERPGKVEGIEVAFGEGGKVMLRGEGEGIEVKIYDASGRLMYSKKVDVRGEEVLRTGLPSGVFMLRLKEGSRSRLLKFVVR